MRGILDLLLLPTAQILDFLVSLPVLSAPSNFLQNDIFVMIMTGGFSATKPPGPIHTDNCNVSKNRKYQAIYGNLINYKLYERFAHPYTPRI